MVIETVVDHCFFFFFFLLLLLLLLSALPYQVILTCLSMLEWININHSYVC